MTDNEKALKWFNHILEYEIREGATNQNDVDAANAIRKALSATQPRSCGIFYSRNVLNMLYCRYETDYRAKIC